MYKFRSNEPTCFENQIGLTLVVGEADETITINAYVCTIEGTHLRVDVEGFPEYSMDVTVPHSNYVEPSISFENEYAYIKFADHEVHVKIEDEGLVLDVWDTNSSDESVDSTYVHYFEVIDSFGEEETE